jgi:hypothetical protein
VADTVIEVLQGFKRVGLDHVEAHEYHRTRKLLYALIPLITSTGRNFLVGGCSEASATQRREPMRKRMLAFLFLVLVVGNSVIIPGDNKLYAISGCCKQRRTYRENTWTQTPMSFEECRSLNERIDRDDVFAAQGLVWWDVRCQ